MTEQRRLEEALTFFQSLPFDEQVRIEDLAVQNSNRFCVDTYHRLKPIGGPLYEEMRVKIIADQVAAMSPKIAIRDI